MSKEMVINLKKIESIKESNALVMKIIQNPSVEAKEQLLNEFKKYVNDCKTKKLSENKNYFFAIQCLIMFSELNMKEAFDLITEFLQIDESIIEFELGKAFDKSLYKIIANSGDNRENEIKAIIKNKKLGFDVKRAFSLALAKMTYMGKVDIEETTEFYKTIMLDKNEEIGTRYFVAYDANSLGLSELSDLIKETDMEVNNIPPWEYDELNKEETKKVSEMFEEKVDLTDYLYLYEEADEVLNSVLSKRGGTGKNNKNNNIYDFEKEKPRNTIKIGRNDPCFCGSGKKYKKCCGK